MTTKDEQQLIAQVLNEKLVPIKEYFNDIICYHRQDEPKIAIAFSDIYIPSALIEIVQEVCDEQGVEWYVSDICSADTRYPLYINIY